MKTLTDFLAEAADRGNPDADHIVYPNRPDVPGGGANGPKPAHKVNATKLFLKHHENHIFLERVAQHHHDPAVRARAEIELPIAERQMKKWSGYPHPAYNHEEAMRGMEANKKSWDHSFHGNPKGARIVSKAAAQDTIKRNKAAAKISGPRVKETGNYRPGGHNARPSVSDLVTHVNNTRSDPEFHAPQKINWEKDGKKYRQAPGAWKTRKAQPRHGEQHGVTPTGQTRVISQPQPSAREKHDFSVDHRKPQAPHLEKGEWRSLAARAGGSVTRPAEPRRTLTIKGGTGAAARQPDKPAGRTHGNASVSDVVKAPHEAAHNNPKRLFSKDRAASFQAPDRKADSEKVPEPHRGEMKPTNTFEPKKELAKARQKRSMKSIIKVNQ